MTIIFICAKIENNSQISISSVLRYVNANHDKSFSAKEIADGLKDMNISISAVYRNLVDLEKEGKIRKVAKSGTREAFYQFIDCDECKEHLHITCTKCGKTTHLPDADSAMIIQKVLNKTNFDIDKNNTILYGVCDKCKK